MLARATPLHIADTPLCFIYRVSHRILLNLKSKHMKVKVTKSVKITEEIEVSFPYYYICDMTDDDSDCVIYGKKEEKTETTIRERRSWRGDVSYEIEKDCMNGSYFDDEFKSTEEEFQSAKVRALAFLNEC